MYYTPHRRYSMGLLSAPTCTSSKRDQRDLIHLLWRCPKLLSYRREVVDILNRVFFEVFFSF